MGLKWVNMYKEQSLTHSKPLVNVTVIITMSLHRRKYTKKSHKKKIYQNVSNWCVWMMGLLLVFIFSSFYIFMFPKFSLDIYLIFKNKIGANYKISIAHCFWILCGYTYKTVSGGDPAGSFHMIWNILLTGLATRAATELPLAWVPHPHRITGEHAWLYWVVESTQESLED